MRRIIRDPYAGVNWGSAYRVKAALHTHSRKPETTLSFTESVDRHHELGFGALALTEHDSRSEGIKGLTPRTSPDATPEPRWPWTAYGRDPDALGMIAVQGNEMSWTHHHWNSLFNDTWRTSDRGPGGPFETISMLVPEAMALVGSRGGLARLNHPDREPYGDDQAHVDLFAAHPYLVGMEVLNRNILYPADKPRWDRLLQLSREQGLSLPIWGCATDDSHSLVDPGSGIGFSYEIHMLPEKTSPALRTSIESGSFWCVNDPLGTINSRHVRADDPTFFTAAPVIHSIDVRADRITVYATGHNGVQWVSDGEVVHTGATLPLDHPDLGLYVRAEMYGDDGPQTLTQPWHLEAGEPGSIAGHQWSIVRGDSLESVTPTVIL